MITDEPMLPLISRIRMWWNAADRTQRVVTLGGIGALLLLLVGTTLFATRPQYETLFSGLSEMEKGQIVEGLTTLGIPEEHSETGVVKVPKGKAEDAMMGLAKAQKLPKESGHWDLEKYKDVTMGTSPAMEGQIIKAVLEGRLARTIEHSEGVASATVLLNIPEKRIFAENGDHPTASVTLVEGGRGTISRNNGRVIANLVCNAVDGMTPQDVFVASNNLGVLWDGKENREGSFGGTKAEMDAKASRDIEATIQATLDPVFGPGNTKVVANADLNLDRTTSSEDNSSPSDRPGTVQKVTESMTGTKGSLPGGAMGATPNTTAQQPAQPPTTASTTGTPSKYENSKQAQEFLANRHTEATTHAVGGYNGLSLVAIVNSEKVSDPKAVQTILNGVLAGKMKMDAQGVPIANQAFSATVTSVKFDGTAGVAAKAAADAAASQQRTQQIISLLPIGAILLVALLVAKQVGKISRSILPALPTAEETLAEGYAMDALPAGSVTDLTPAAITSHMERTAIPMTEVELEEFNERVDIPLESIKKMANERPETVAILIKSMMLGDI